MLPLLLLMPVMILIVGAIGAMIPNVVGLIINATNMPQNIYSLLIEIPRPLWDSSVYLMPPLTGNATSAAANANATAAANATVAVNATSGYSGVIGHSMTSLFAASRTAAFVMLIFVVIIAALAFFMQNFRLVAEGTAVRILTGTVMTVVLIYIFPAIYDVIATAANSVTRSIATPDTIYTIVSYAAAITPNTPTTNTTAPFGANLTGVTYGLYSGYTATLPSTATSGAASTSDIGSLLAGMTMNLFLLIFTMITYVGIAIMGILRTFFIGAAFALMPVLLVMRLMPYIDRVADLFIQVIIGGILASVIASFFFAFGCDVLMNPSISGLMKTLIAIGVLLASSMMMTVLIPHLGSLMSSISTAITGAATGAAVGGIAVATGAAVVGAQAAPALMAGVRTEQLSPGAAILRGAGAVLAGGASTFGSVAPRIVPGAGAWGYAIPAAISTGRGVGGMSFIQRYAVDHPETADALILQAAATPHDMEGDPVAMARYATMVRTDLLTRPPEVLGREYERMTGVKVSDPAEVGKAIQGRIRQIMEMTSEDKQAQNILLSRIGRAYNAWKEHGIELKGLMDEAWEEAAEHSPKDTADLAVNAQEIFQKKLGERGLTGLSPIMRVAAVRDRKINADKVAEFVQKRKGVQV